MFDREESINTAELRRRLLQLVHSTVVLPGYAPWHALSVDHSAKHAATA